MRSPEDIFEPVVEAEPMGHEWGDVDAFDLFDVHPSGSVVEMPQAHTPHAVPSHESFGDGSAPVLPEVLAVDEAAVGKAAVGEAAVEAESAYENEPVDFELEADSWDDVYDVDPFDALDGEFIDIGGDLAEAGREVDLVDG